MHLYVYSKANPPESNSARRFFLEGPRSPSSAHPSPHPAPASWPVCGPVSPLLVFRAQGLGADPSWSALQERGLLGDPQSGLGTGWRGVWGLGGVPDRLMRTPNAPQPGPLIASRLAGSEPGPPPGSINSPSLQMAAGSSLASRFTGDWGGGSRWRTPTPPHWGKEAPAAAPPCCPVRDTGPEGAAEVEPIAWRRETEAQKGQGTVQGRW